MQKFDAHEKTQNIHVLQYRRYNLLNYMGATLSSEAMHALCCVHYVKTTMFSESMKDLYFFTCFTH